MHHARQAAACKDDLSDLKLEGNGEVIGTLATSWDKLLDRVSSLLIGFNVTAEEGQFSRGAAPIPNFVLSPDKLELAVTKAAAHLIWIDQPSACGFMMVSMHDHLSKVILVVACGIYIGDYVGTVTTHDKSIRCIAQQLGCHLKHSPVPKAQWAWTRLRRMRQWGEEYLLNLDLDDSCGPSGALRSPPASCAEGTTGVGKDATIRPPSLTWFVSCKLRPKKSLENTSEGSSDSPRSCHIFHGMLVMIHIILVIFYINHWEHHVTLSFTPRNNNVWPVVLSASLQAFYTIYTAGLLFLTQWLAISRTLVRRLKLTAIHDITGAWADLGSALSSVWRQTNIPASWWTTFAVTTYLASISVLHVTSSTLLQFQTFNTSIATSVPTTLGWPNDIPYDSDANWEFMTASLPVVNHLPGLVTAGLSNTTLYDTIRTSSVGGNATVNATTITSCCGLLPNITLHGSLLMIDPFNIPGLSTTFCITMEVPWSDLIQVLQIIPCNVSEFAIAYVRLLRVDSIMKLNDKLQDRTHLLFWCPVSSLRHDNNISAVEENDSNQMDYVIPVYVILCSLSGSPTDGMVDMQNNSLLSPVPIWQPSKQWEKYQWTKNDTWEVEIVRALSSPIGSGYEFSTTNNTGAVEPSMADESIMTLVGLNLSAAYSQWGAFDSTNGPNATFIVRQDKLELAVTKVVAQLIWLARAGHAVRAGLARPKG
ncbi:hypothetical protein DFH29DRAFT_881780 [Suillus ampliporus]|nr:hypothetical protein DFH29DRAFT_881780 [Suillus ampliporus]